MLHLLILSSLRVSSVVSECSEAYTTILNENLEKNVVAGCGTDWQYFDRPSGAWCMKFFPGNFTETEAEDQCETHGAVVSGIQTYEEVDYISNATLAQINKTSGSVWLGLKRTDACMNSRLTATCTKYNSFEWTDNSTTGTEMFNIFRGPDNDKLGQSRVMLLVAYVDYVSDGSHVFYSKQMDDVEDDPLLPFLSQERGLVGMICGKKSPKQ